MRLVIDMGEAARKLAPFHYAGPAVWAIRPQEVGLFTTPSSATEVLKNYLGGSLERVIPIYVSKKPAAFPADLDDSKILRPETPSPSDKAAVLIRFAEESGARCIIVSAPVRSIMSGMIRDSFSEILLRESPLPIWFMPRRGLRSLKPSRAMFATDFSPRSRESFGEFLRFIQGSARELILYHAIEVPIEAMSACGTAGVPGYYPEAEIREEKGRSLQIAKEWIQMSRFMGISTRVHAVIRETVMGAGRAIVDVASREKIGLIGMTSERTPLERSIFGSTVRGVFREQTHPVWVFGPKAQRPLAQNAVSKLA